MATSRPVGRSDLWSEEDLEVFRYVQNYDSREIQELFPGRSLSSIRGMQQRLRQHEAEQPPVKAPGDYIEYLSAYLVDEWDCMQIWCKWNGYACYRELSRDILGWVTLLCTAKA